MPKMPEETMILCIELNEDIRQLLTDHFEMSGYSIATVSDPEKALDYMKNDGALKLVVMDIVQGRGSMKREEIHGITEAVHAIYRSKGKEPPRICLMGDTLHYKAPHTSEYDGLMIVGREEIKQLE